MNKLIFTSVYGDETRTVEICSPSGGGGTFHITEDKRYLGAVVLYMRTNWTVVPQRRDFTTDDMQVILERMIEAGMISV